MSKRKGGSDIRHFFGQPQKIRKSKEREGEGELDDDERAGRASEVEGLAFRGQNEKEDSPNRGNFLECMNMLKKFDPFLQRYETPANTTYLSPSSQIELIKCCSTERELNIVQERACANINNPMVMPVELSQGPAENFPAVVKTLQIINTPTAIEGNRKRMEDYVVDWCHVGPAQTCLKNHQSHLKQRLFYPCIDRMTSELENRFSSVGSDVMIGIQACHPAPTPFCACSPSTN
ncbi:unnamed protein product [Pleuronectes platessa]|uniref:Uncharacterized protein n=1 Tax=Pleuronectes platessa TaxID=8262 RepID=A0A9N7V8R7_PLEPL|nr:unnamed protein product [Pleuronectes platessa]